MHKKEYNDARKVFVPPCLISTQSRGVNLSTVRTGLVVKSEMLQSMFDVAANLVDQYVTGNRITEANMVSADDMAWIHCMKNEPCIGLYGDNKQRRLPVTLGLERDDPDADCHALLLDALQRTHGVLTHAQWYVTLPFHEARVQDRGPFVHYAARQGVWRPPHMRVVDDGMSSVAWTCCVRAAILEEIACRYEFAEVAYYASACMQTHCPLAIYLTGLESMHDDELDNTLLSEVYPRPDFACWAPKTWDLSHLLHNSGFFYRKEEKSDTGRKKATAEDTQKDLHSFQVAMEHVQQGYAVLESILDRSLPFKCVIRGMVPLIEKEHEADSSIGDMMVEFFNCSLLGGYPRAQFRPCFVAMMHLYDQFVLNPSTTAERLAWIQKNRRDEVDEFEFDEKPANRHVWDGHALGTVDSASFAKNAAMPAAISKVEELRALNGPRRPVKKPAAPRNGTGPNKKKKKDSRSSDTQSLQKLMMVALQEMITHAMDNVPGLYFVIRKSNAWDSVADNVVLMMDTVRRSVSNALAVKHSNALRMHVAMLHDPLVHKPFYEWFARAWPRNVFFTSIRVLKARESALYQWHKPKENFESQVVAICKKIDAERRTAVERFNARQDVYVEPEAMREAMKWGVWDPRTLGTTRRAMYVCDFLERQFPPMVAHLRDCKRLMDTAMVLPEAPVNDKLLFFMGCHVALPDMFLKFRENSRAESAAKPIRNALLELPVDEYAVVSFFYSYVQKKRKIQIIELPVNITEAQRKAVGRKYNKAVVTDSMTTVLICPCCDTIKAYPANQSQRHVSAYGNKMTLVDPITEIMYCGNKMRKPSKDRRAKDHDEINADFLSGDIRDKTQRRHQRVFKSHAESERKMEIRKECANTPLIAVVLLGKWLVFDGKNYVICMDCGSTTQITSQCAPGDKFSCGQCKPHEERLFSVCCALCQTAYVHCKTALPILDAAEKRAELDKYLATLDTTFTRFPKYTHTWVSHTVYDNSSVKSGIPPPYTGMAQTAQDGRITKIHVCPTHDEQWLLYVEGMLMWSEVYKANLAAHVSFYVPRARMFMAQPRSKQQMENYVEARDRRIMRNASKSLARRGKKATAAEEPPPEPEVVT